MSMDGYTLIMHNTHCKNESVYSTPLCPNTHGLVCVLGQFSVQYTLSFLHHYGGHDNCDSHHLGAPMTTIITVQLEVGACIDHLYVVPRH